MVAVQDALDNRMLRGSPESPGGCPPGSLRNSPVFAGNSGYDEPDQFELSATAMREFLVREVVKGLRQDPPE